MAAHGSAERIVLGVDSSTQSTKVLAVDVATGAVRARGHAPHTVSTGAARESDPEMWWRALLDALGQLGEYAPRAEAIAIAGQQHGLVALDDAGHAVRPALLWNDVRSAPQAAALVQRHGAAWWADRFGSVPGASFTAAKWAWLCEHEPESARAAAAVRLPHDFLTERLCGAGVTDRGDASGTGWWRSDTETYDDTLLAGIGLDPALLPRVLGPREPAGQARGGLPLRAGALVAPGTGDNAAAALGLGLAPGQAALSLGTSGTVYTVARTRPADPTGTVAGFASADGRWLPLACTLNCTLAVDRVAALLGRDREDVEAGGSAVMLPYLDGERTPDLPHASGLLTGLRHDTTAGQVLQAAYDGAVFSLLAALDGVLAVDGGAAPDEPLILIGGGARGAAWTHTVRRLSGRTVRVPDAGELVALGAAVQAAAVLTGEPFPTLSARWRTGAGPLLPPLPRDEPTLTRLHTTLQTAWGH